MNTAETRSFAHDADAVRLPATLEHAMVEFGDAFVDCSATVEQSEINRCNAAVTDRGDGAGLRAHDLRDVPGHRSSSLNRWENWMPQARTALDAQGRRCTPCRGPGRPS